MSVTVPPPVWPTNEPLILNRVDSRPDASTIPSSGASVSHGPRDENFSPTHPRRHSLHTLGARKPLRSSPLAGPALQADGSSTEVAGVPKPAPSRITSTPDFAPLLVHPSRVKRARPRTADSLQISSSLSQYPTTSQAQLKHPLSFSSALKELVKQGTSKESERSTCLVQPLSSLPAPSVGVCPQSTYENDSVYKTSPPPHATVRRPKTAHGYPTTPESPPGPYRSSAEHQSSFHSRDADANSWLVTNTYETTPKFSRLGLASQNVVLPVSAKKRKPPVNRTPKSSGDASTVQTTRTEGTKCSPYTGPPPPPEQSATSLPNPSLTGCSGSNPTSESLASLQSGEVTVPVLSTTAITERNECDLRHHSTSKPPLAHRCVSPTLPKKGPLSQLKVLSLRTIRSSKSLTKSCPAPISEKLTKDAIEPLHGEIKLGFFTSPQGSPMASESIVEYSPAVYEKVSSLPSNRESSVKKFWKSITSWQHNLP